MQDTEGHMVGPVSQHIKNYTGQTSILKIWSRRHVHKVGMSKGVNPEQSKKP